MFVPVACSQCGKPFQVPEAAVGQPAVCPWCQAAVIALPVGKPATAPSAGATPPADSRPPVRREEPEPLPLDDLPSQPRAKSRWFRWWMIPVGLVLLVVAAVATVGVLRYKQGYLVGREWRPFSPKDDSCAVVLLGSANPAPDAPTGQTRYVSEGWYSGTTAWVGWRDLTQVETQLAGTKDAWKEFGKVFEAERDWLKGRYDGAVVTKTATTKFEDPLTHEIRVEYPGGRAVERVLVFPGGRNPRVYFVGIAGRIEPDGPEAQRLFDSFRVAG